jgi:hypothetical protein
MYDIIILGAGVAGLTSAIYALRQGKKVLVLEKNSFGGQIINAQDIENYPGSNHISGYELSLNIYNQAKELGMEYKQEEVLEIDPSNKSIRTNKESYTYKALIIAMGLEKRKLGLENEQDLIGSGVSYCATCDGAFFKNKNVAVVGGGNTALEDALFLSEYVNKVYLIHRRDTFRGDENTLSKIKTKENIELVLNSIPTKLIGKPLEQIEVEDKNNNKKLLDVNGIFIAVGQKPSTEILRNILELDEYGYIITDKKNKTSQKYIYAAGDIVKKEVRQLTTAVADGTIAAINACRDISI